MYQLVFRGEWEAGLDEASARERARGLFKANDAQLEKMFSGSRVVIKNRLDESAAQKYQAAMKKNGLVAHIEPMQQAGAESEPAARQPESPGEGSDGARESAGAFSGKASAPSGGNTVAVEPGDRLPVAGEKVDSILTGSDLSLGAPGESLGEPREEPEPVFQHLEEWSVAPPGEDLGAREEKPEPPAPDVSHLSLAKDSDHGTQ